MHAKRDILKITVFFLQADSGKKKTVLVKKNTHKSTTFKCIAVVQNSKYDTQTLIIGILVLKKPGSESYRHPT